LKPLGWRFPKDKVKDIPNPFLERPEKGYGKDTTAGLQVFGRTRTSKIESAQVLSSDDSKWLWKGHQDKKTSRLEVSRCYEYGSSKFRDEEIERLRFQFSNFISVIYKVFYRLQRFQKGKASAR
jgi:hypothetical protein